MQSLTAGFTAHLGFKSTPNAVPAFLRLHQLLCCPHKIVCICRKLEKTVTANKEPLLLVLCFSAKIWTVFSEQKNKAPK